ncbi:hypothetical protein BDV26DRAFT_264163 [Aspergillus bertholletiae]|uniref:Uncharacterized protein n=1 Tax=Aspergillus bertholletiae TaxID=1226010 RepID=A0A5N7B714_9EURO|nr:hypothetical protein BDV26DRAFT_264163 [Aspergillus bertholletiae]
MKDFKSHLSEGFSPDLNRLLHRAIRLTSWGTNENQHRVRSLSRGISFVLAFCFPPYPGCEPEQIGKVKPSAGSWVGLSPWKCCTSRRGIGHIQSRGPYHLIPLPGDWAYRIPCFALLQIHLDVLTSYQGDTPLSHFAPCWAIHRKANSRGRHSDRQHQPRSPDLRNSRVAVPWKILQL